MPYKRKKKAYKTTEPVLKTIYQAYGGRLHLLGKPGPRGGKKSLCGLPASRIARWGVDYYLREGVTHSLKYISCADCRERIAI